MSSHLIKKSNQNKTMKNILGTTKDLELFNKDGKIVYKFRKNSIGCSFEYTYDENGNVLTSKNSNGGSCEYTRDEKGNVLTFKNSNGYYRIKEKYVTQQEYEAFINGIPEYTMEELEKILGHKFKIKQL